MLMVLLNVARNGHNTAVFHATDHAHIILSAGAGNHDVRDSAFFLGVAVLLANMVTPALLALEELVAEHAASRMQLHHVIDKVMDVVLRLLAIRAEVLFHVTL